MLNSKALAASVSAPPRVYVEDVFSTWLYTGNGSTQTITNGIDLAGKGGLVWIKGRNAVQDHQLFDTSRGATKELISNSFNAATTDADTLTAFNANGFDVGADANTNTNGTTYTSWTFRKAAKFFDVVTYTGNGSNRTITHGLGSVPRCIMIKDVTAGYSWIVYHSALTNLQYLFLNNTDAASTAASVWNSTTPTSSNFSVGTDVKVNTNGNTYVAYLFAHDAGGFGDSGNDSVIKCGSYTGNGSTTGPVVDLGWEPQWLLIKSADTGGWFVFDSMRGITTGGAGDNYLRAESSDAEQTNTANVDLLLNGFQPVTTAGGVNNSGITITYIAIRRGPMKKPTDATKVFGLNARSGTGANATVTGGQIDDAVLIKNRGSAVGDLFAARLTGAGYLDTSSTAAEVTAGTTILQANPWDVMDGIKVGTTSTITNASSNTFINYLFRRAPGFFDVVAYTGTGANRTVSHNLGVVPELMIVKRRDTSADWQVYAGAAGEYLVLNTTAAKVTSNTDRWNNTAPTSSVFSLGTNAVVNANAGTYVAYLFATVSGVSKVGSYTGNGSSQTINCGFTAGSRFVLIKRTDSTGDWLVADTARGIVSANDPLLRLNSTAAEVTTLDWLDPDSSGFIVNQEATANANVNNATYIYLSIA